VPKRPHHFCITSKWLRTCSDCLLFEIIWHHWYVRQSFLKYNTGSKPVCSSHTVDSTKLFMIIGSLAWLRLSSGLMNGIIGNSGNRKWKKESLKYVYIWVKLYRLIIKTISIQRPPLNKDNIVSNITYPVINTSSLWPSYVSVLFTDKHSIYRFE